MVTTESIYIKKIQERMELPGNLKETNVIPLYFKVWQKDKP